MKYPVSKEIPAHGSSELREMPLAFRGMAVPDPLPVSDDAFLGRYFTKAGFVDIAAVADGFCMSKVQLAETAGLPATTVTKNDRMIAPKTQGRMTEMLEIIARIKDWAGSETQAMAWYRAQPIPALDGRTAESLVKTGDAAAVRDYLDHMALGGFA
jgi:uncharacterized protein (DUF2384 family)